MMDRERKKLSEMYKSIEENRLVNIKNAIIEVDTELQYGMVACLFSLTNCVVKGLFSFRFITFGESVSFIDTVFEDGIDLTGCRIQGQFVNQDVEFRSEAEFEGLSVGGHAYFERIVFKVSPNFSMTSWGLFTRFSEIEFEMGAAFLSSTFGGHIFLENNCQVTGAAVDLSLATINGMLSVERSCFDQPLCLTSVNTIGAIQISSVEFGPEAMLDMYQARIGSDLRIEDSKFLSNNSCLRLDEVKVEGGCSVLGINCRGGVYARNATFRSYLDIGESQEQVDNKKKKSQFTSAFSLSDSKVNGFFNCTNSIFRGHVPEGEDPWALFDGMKVGESTYIIGCVFGDGVNFNRSQFTGVFGTNSRYRKFVGWQGTRFYSAVRFLPGCVFRKGTEFYFCNFKEEVNFGNANIYKQLSLNNCRFRHSLLFFDPMHIEQRYDGYAQFKAAVLKLEGSTYDAIGPATANFIKEVLNRIPDTPEEDTSLVFLEKWLRRSGRQNEANDVRYRRFDQLKDRTPDLWQRIWNYFYKFSTKYGTVVWPAFLVSVLTGVAALAVPQGYWFDLVTKFFATVSAITLGLCVDGVKRRLWPQ